MSFKERVDRIKDLIVTRAQAYQQVFSPKNVFTETVLADLAKFCRANDSAFDTDSRVHAVLEGRREVWLRICHHTKLDPEQLWAKYGRNIQ